MEADSTTLESDHLSDLIAAKDRDYDLFDCHIDDTSFYHITLKPILSQKRELQLIEWMKDRCLLPSSKCSRSTPACEMKTVKAKVIDKYQWQCKECKLRASVRENSMFKNWVGISLANALKVIQAWCIDMDYIYVSSCLAVKHQLVNSMFAKIENVIGSKAQEKLGGPDSVLFVEMYPDGTVEHIPDSSKSDSHLTKTKILCLADTKYFPTKYLMHVMTGNVKRKTENNNTTVKKMKPAPEIIDFISRNVHRGGFCMIGSSSDLNTLPELLAGTDFFDGVMSIETLSSKASSQMEEFVTDTVWRQAVTLCEAAQDLPKKDMQTYLNCSLWRREMSELDSFPIALQLLAEQCCDPQGTKRCHNGDIK